MFNGRVSPTSKSNKIQAAPEQGINIHILLYFLATRNISDKGLELFVGENLTFKKPNKRERKRLARSNLNLADKTTPNDEKKQLSADEVCMRSFVGYYIKFCSLYGKCIYLKIQ